MRSFSLALLTLLSLLPLLPRTAQASKVNLLSTYTTQGKRALITLIPGKGTTRLVKYDTSHKVSKAITLTGAGTALCSNGANIVVGTGAGDLLLFDMELAQKAKAKTLPILSLLCLPKKVFVGAKSIKIREYALPSLVFKRVAKEHASWVSKIFRHPKEGYISVSWAHRARRWGKGSPLVFKFFSGPIDAALSTVHHTLAIVTDRDKIRFYSTKNGRKLNWAKTAGALSIATAGKLLLVGLPSGYVQRFLFRGNRFKKSGALPILRKSPIEAMVPLSDGTWAFLSKGKIHFKKVK